MKYTYVDKSHTIYGNRIWVHNSLSSDLRIILDYCSRWGAYDKVHGDYLSWELKSGTEKTVLEILGDLGYSPQEAKETFALNSIDN